MHNEKILKKGVVNFFGFESIDENGKHHYHPWVIRGNGDLLLKESEITFRQWLIKKEYSIKLKDIIRLEIKRWHNLKAQYPGGVLRIFYKQGNQTKIFGAAVGGKLSVTKGFSDDAEDWKQAIEEALRRI